MEILMRGATNQALHDTLVTVYRDCIRVLPFDRTDFMLHINLQGKITSWTKELAPNAADTAS
jgi:hypothetical protein